METKAFKYSELSEMAKEQVYLNSLEGNETFFNDAEKSAMDEGKRVFSINLPTSVDAKITLIANDGNGWGYEVETEAIEGSEEYEAVIAAAKLAVKAAQDTEEYETSQEYWEKTDTNYQDEIYDEDGNRL